MALPPPTWVEMGAFYQILGWLELSASARYATKNIPTGYFSWELKRYCATVPLGVHPRSSPVGEHRDPPADTPSVGCGAAPGRRWLMHFAMLRWWHVGETLSNFMQQGEARVASPSR